jgi:hypothetical protein
MMPRARRLTLAAATRGLTAFATATDRVPANTAVK